MTAKKHAPYFCHGGALCTKLLIFTGADYAGASGRMPRHGKSTILPRLQFTTSIVQ